MAGTALEITVVKDSGDCRGRSFPVPGECFGDGFSVRDAHLTTLLPGHVRGDHYHVTRNEILLVMASDLWSLHWDSGEGTPVGSRLFDGSDAVLIRVPPHASHAIRNDGSAPLQIFGLTDGPYDPAEPDAFPRRVTSGGEGQTGE
jgi:oxalate decarboxylase/phosphoglucose isomerase-like protein (cupin superfamily)